MRLPKQHLRIGLISDTHIEHEGDDVLPEVYEHFAGVDLILHAGDIYIPQMLDRLERIAPLVVVAGNGEEDRNVQDPRLADSRVIELGGLKVGLRRRSPSSRSSVACGWAAARSAMACTPRILGR